MTTEKLPRPADELERLAGHYSEHDAADEIEASVPVSPEPMATTSLRLPADITDALKDEAARQGIRYTTLARRVLERHVRSGGDIASIREQLDRIERRVEQPR